MTSQYFQADVVIDLVELQSKISRARDRRWKPASRLHQLTVNTLVKSYRGGLSRVRCRHIKSRVANLCISARCRPESGWNSRWRDLRLTCIGPGCEVNGLIDEFGCECLPAIDLAHVDLAEGEQRPCLVVPAPPGRVTDLILARRCRWIRRVWPTPPKLPCHNAVVAIRFVNIGQ